MSFEAMAWAVEQNLSCTDKMVLLMLANRVNKDSGQCTPSMRRLADDCGLSERTTRDAIRRLEAAGLIETIHRKLDENTNLSNSYRMLQNVPVGRQMPEGGAANAPGGGAANAEKPVINKPVIEPLNIKPSSYTANDLVSIGVDEAIARDFMEVRKRKKAPLTETAMRGIVREAKAAGYTINQAIQVCAERGWQSFKAEWVRNKNTGGYISYYELATGQRPEF